MTHQELPDHFRAARGILIGCIAGGVCWLLIAGAIALWRAVFA